MKLVGPNYGITQYTLDALWLSPQLGMSDFSNFLMWGVGCEDDQSQVSSVLSNYIKGYYGFNATQYH